MGSAAVLMPNEELSAIAEHIVTEINFPHTVYIRTVNRDNALSALKSLPSVDLIISRGRIAEILQKEVSIPVVPVISNAQEVGLLVLEAKRLSRRRRPLIALVGFENAYCDVSHFSELFQADVRTYHEPYDPENRDVRRIVDRALRDGADAAVCGSRSQKLWEEAGIPYVLFRTGEESLREAFHIAGITLYAHDLEQRNTARLKTLINSLTSAIIELDSAGRIVSYNHVADESFHLTMRDSVGEPLSSRLPFIPADLLNRTVFSGEEAMGTGRYSRSAFWIYNIVPYAAGSGAAGAVAVLQETQAVERMNRMSRQEFSRSVTTAAVRPAALKSVMTDCPEIHTRIRAFSASASPVLIEGEPGLETRDIALAIHHSGEFSLNPFVAVNCAELTESDQRTMLFGSAEFRGCCLNAHQGTLFLNRPEFLSRESQMRLIRVMEEKAVLTCTDPEPVPVSVRVISYIPDPSSELSSGRLVPEFLAALGVLGIHVPPLRNRPADLRRYLDSFFKKSCKQYGRPAVLTEDAIRELLRFSWPGNIRQLSAFCEKLVLTMRHRSISQADVVNLLREGAALGFSSPEAEASSPSLQNSEAQHILSCLEQYQWRRDEAAAALGISRSTLWRKINQYGLIRK